MDWKNLPGSGNVEDRRGAGGLPGGGIAVGGVGGLIIALIAMFFGIDPGAILGGGNSSQPTQQSQSTQTTQNDEAYQFVDRVLGSTDQVWGSIFRQAGRTYKEPRLVLYTRGTQSGCGQADSAVGPFYCPTDQKIYLDTSFFTQMDRQLGGGGDFAYAYVIAHEVGHHIQNELGIADQVNRRQRSARTEAEANSYSVRLELQADCFAGVWGNKTQQDAKITQADVQEAVATAEAIGDDNLQRQGQGYVAPDSFTHGSAAQRVRWFMTGFRSGNPNSCDTFNVNYNQL
ncbi:neutral zinc metallopeptidase [Deinococcus soli (ex Cha et al. 2016)]|uniref:Membrane protein n=1 Tax=Deinococcus soli (ex Cha et al. 2016) TaxID=1309411 RepID=A0A0F7JMR9_9DEIO|nr:neutral zinc metallopeptidase [Deinococcus soli (ex Cha et al. 2016)]AKH16654.1 membrane protein [Deinococcus soli (ex Cha et al. 2016)]